MVKAKEKAKKKNNKIAGKGYHYYHGDDCYIYARKCLNCNKEVGSWSPEQADKAWEEHKC